MASVIAVTFDNLDDAPKAREALRSVEKAGYLSLDDSAVIVKDEHGKLKVEGQADRGVKTGAVAGGLIGLLLMGIFPIGGIILGALAGAGIGASVDLGIDKKFVKSLSDAMQPNTSGLIIYVRGGNPSAIFGALEPYKGQIFQTSLTPEQEETLHRMLDK